MSKPQLVRFLFPYPPPTPTKTGKQVYSWRVVWQGKQCIPQHTNSNNNSIKHTSLNQWQSQASWNTRESLSLSFVIWRCSSTLTPTSTILSCSSTLAQHVWEDYVHSLSSFLCMVPWVLPYCAHGLPTLEAPQYKSIMDPSASIQIKRHILMQNNTQCDLNHVQRQYLYLICQTHARKY